jgi:hypothetical protein
MSVPRHARATAGTALLSILMAFGLLAAIAAAIFGLVVR